MENKSYQELEIWKKGIDLVVDVYEMTNKFPKHELFGLTSQMRRAAVSVPSNIAEGWARNSKKSFLVFLNYSKSSLSELTTQFIIARKLNYINDKDFERINIKINELGKMIYAFQSSIKNQLQAKKVIHVTE